MKIEPQDYLQKLVEVYQAQCNQYLQERINLQAQLDLVLKEIEILENKLLEANPEAKELEELDPKLDEVENVNSNTDT